MPSSPTTRNRFELIAPGEQLNGWGGPNGLNRVITLLDATLDGWLTISATGSTTLTSTNYAADQARLRIIKYTGASTGTLTVPSVEKWYIVKAASTGDCVLTAGGASATVKAGDTALVLCDGSDCYKVQSNNFGGAEIVNIAAGSASTSAIRKSQLDALETSLIAYVNAQAFAETNLPGITAETAGQFVGNNGTSADWYWDGYQGRSTKSADYTIALTDRQKLIAATAALNFTMTAATTLTSYFTARIANEAATAYVTITASGSDTINGASSITLAPGDVVDITGDGTSAFIAKYVVQQAQGPHVIVQDQKSSGTGGGTSAATSYQTRTLNTVVRNTVGASLSSNEVTLPAGTWRLEAWAPGRAVEQHRVRIYNVTDAATAVLGASNFSSNGTAVTTFALADGVVTTTASKAFRVDHYTNTSAANGLGSPVSTGEVEIYTEFRATRISG